MTQAEQLRKENAELWGALDRIGKHIGITFETRSPPRIASQIVHAITETGIAHRVRIYTLREALRPFAFYSEDNPEQTVQEAWELRYQDRLKDWIDFYEIDAARAAMEQTPIKP